MNIRGVFHALPPSVFGSRIRTRDDLAAFVRGTHAIAASDRLDIADAADGLTALCERLELHGAMGRQPLAIPGTVTADYLPAYRLPALADRIDAVTPGTLAAAIGSLGTHPLARDSHWIADKGGLARLFLQLKRFHRNCATQRADVLFVQHAAPDGAEG
ncbi:hypothetical protein [Denitromonas iodatirespirans]|uniref:Uncharacterized protein n=1 Tax=Denitromonas iodatirespirans TaxID=2795389 RepID=A0A944D782_DENI1|nr:hypothetical protein [Denitromonas iodatirespirans]MBT0961229.1 hypothetical protein [Denitromonas iodatirespirans]